MHAVSVALVLCQLCVTALAVPDAGGIDIFPAFGNSNSSVDQDLLEYSANADVSSPHVLFARQKRCPYPVMCGADWCCPAGSICVSSSSLLNRP